MFLGMFFSAFARTTFKGESQRSLHHFWEMVAYIANTLTFILSGVVIAEGILNAQAVFNHGTSWTHLLLLYAYLQVSRCIVVGALFPFLRYFGYGLDWKEAIILVWAGLQGNVALLLSLSFKRSSGKSLELTSEIGTQFVFFTGGVVFLTLIVNGSTTQFLLHYVDLDKLSAAKRRILDFTKYEMLNKALEAFRELGDEELGPADWPTVKRYISCLNDMEGECVHPHGESQSNTELDPMCHLLLLVNCVVQMVLNMCLKDLISPTLLWTIVSQFDENIRRPTNFKFHGHNVAEELEAAFDCDIGADKEEHENCMMWSDDHDDQTVADFGSNDLGSNEADPSFPSYFEENGLFSSQDQGRFENVDEFLFLSMGFSSKQNAWACLIIGSIKNLKSQKFILLVKMDLL